MSASPRSPQQLVIGLTGGIGSGKSSVGSLFAERGVAVIDADAIAHRLTAPDGLAMPAIRAAFGANFVDARGALDRAKMRALAFTDASAKRNLEAILHPLIRAETERELANAAMNARPYAMLMIPLLVESGDPHARCDRVLVVDLPEAMQIERVMQRDRLPLSQVQAIMAAQATRAERLMHADDVIDNSGQPAALISQVEALHANYLQDAMSFK